MTLPNPIANNSTEAYLAYKAGVLEVGDLKPSLYSPYLHFDAWLAYWCGLTDTYPLDKNNQPEMLTDEEALVAYLSGATDTYPEEMENPNDVRIVGYLRYLVSVKYGRPETPLNNSELYLSMVHPSTVSNVTPSADFVLDGTAEYPLIDLKVYGDTFQQSTPSPTPESPQSISIVSGTQTVTATDNGEEGEAYTVNLGATELCKIGDYQDYIYKSGNDWYVHKAIQKLVANGSEPWSKGTNAGLVYLSSTGSVAGSADNNPVISTDYTSRFAIEDNSVFLQTVKGRLAVIDTVNATTSDAWKTYLSGHNVTFYYVLETPTDTKITDSTLVNQLEAIIAGGSYDGTTHVVVTASGENLPALLLVIVAKG